LFTTYQEPFWLNAATNTFDELLPFYFACDLAGIDKDKVNQLTNILEGRSFSFPMRKDKDAFKYAFIYWRIVTAIPEMFPDYSYGQRHTLRKRALREVCNRFEIDEKLVVSNYRDFLIKNDLKAVCVCGNNFSVRKSGVIVNCPECNKVRLGK